MNSAKRHNSSLLDLRRAGSEHVRGEQVRGEPVSGTRRFKPTVADQSPPLHEDAKKEEDTKKQPVFTIRLPKTVTSQAKKGLAGRAVSEDERSSRVPGAFTSTGTLPGFVFECDNQTFMECMQRRLFGAQNKLKPIVLSKVHKGMPLFLRNIQKSEVTGPFWATSDPKWRIVPEAWSGRFPVQVRVSIGWNTRGQNLRAWTQSIPRVPLHNQGMYRYARVKNLLTRTETSKLLEALKR